MTDLGGQSLERGPMIFLLCCIAAWIFVLVLGLSLCRSAQSADRLASLEHGSALGEAQRELANPLLSVSDRELPIMRSVTELEQMAAEPLNLAGGVRLLSPNLKRPPASSPVAHPFSASAEDDLLSD